MYFLIMAMRSNNLSMLSPSPVLYGSNSAAIITDTFAENERANHILRYLSEVLVLELIAYVSTLCLITFFGKQEKLP
jgi:hypothetical protein